MLAMYTKNICFQSSVRGVGKLEKHFVNHPITTIASFQPNITFSCLEKYRSMFFFILTYAFTVDVFLCFKFRMSQS